MLYGYSKHEQRVKPSFSGERARCVQCDSELIGKCGEQYAWHWQHKSNKDCDPWKESETEWHRAWKSKFPIEFQEVVIREGDEVHRADIKTVKGVVIEFQNSPIASEHIRIREAFYKSMVWVINAQAFKDKLVLEDIEEAEVGKIREAGSWELFLIERKWEERLLQNEAAIVNKEKSIELLQKLVDDYKVRIENIQNTTGAFKDYNDRVSEALKFKHDLGVIIR